jgi:hypothetical protein
LEYILLIWTFEMQKKIKNIATPMMARKSAVQSAEYHSPAIPLPVVLSEVS